MPPDWCAALIERSLSPGLVAPHVSEFAIAEFGAAIRVSTPAASQLIGDAVELRHRLPKLWAVVRAGKAAPWQARMIAAATAGEGRLPAEAVEWIDSQTAMLCGRVGNGRLRRIVDEALRLFAPDGDGLDPELGGGVMVEDRYVHIDTHAISSDGAIEIVASVDLGDALDLDHALRHGAEVLKALGSADCLDARRAAALGDLARGQTALNLADSFGARTLGVDADTELPAAKRLILHVHLAATATGQLSGTGVSPAAVVEGTSYVPGLSTIRDWCQSSHTDVRVLPIVDLNLEESTVSYAPTVTIRRHVIARDGTCVFPWCNRNARSCDIDHVEPWAEPPPDQPPGGPTQTTTSNLAPLCRTHHRLKTHGRWTITTPSPGIYQWTSPHGENFIRDHHGTQPI